MGDVDITLRHVARRHPDGFLAPLSLPQGVEVLGWEDTQLTAVAVERRPDKVLALRVRGELRALVVEFEYALRRTMGRRIHQLEAMLSADGALSPVFPAAPPMTTLVIVLSGRRRDWPKQRRHRTGWPELGFSGVRYHVDAVYQRTVEELRARGSVLWLVFTPLAKNATAAAIQSVMNELRARIDDPKELAEMYATMLVMADIDPWGYHLQKEIAAMIEHEAVDMMKVSATLRNAFQEGKQEGLTEGTARGIAEGTARGIAEGTARGIAEGTARGIEKMLRRLFFRRLGRTLSEAEQQALATRMASSDPEDIEDRALTLEGETLAAWLLDPNAR